MTRTQLTALVTAIGTGEANTALELRTILTALVDGATLTNEVKLIDCSNAYIASNFDGTGLGINERAGWAICNGSNGTRNWNGKVPLAYGVDYLTMGAAGGSKDAVIVSHSHTAKISNVTGSDPTKFTATNGGSGGGATSNNGSGVINTSDAGESGAGKNMQPYTVVLAIMKL